MKPLAFTKSCCMLGVLVAIALAVWVPDCQAVSWGAATQAGVRSKAQAKAFLRSGFDGELRKRGGALTTDGRQAVDAALERGAATLARDQFAPEKLRQADANTRKWAAKLAETSGRLIDARDVQAWLSWFCPLYPFC